jgi:hypothetical protein
MEASSHRTEEGEHTISGQTKVGDSKKSLDGSKSEGDFGGGHVDVISGCERKWWKWKMLPI